jgi:hypothetical protein
MKIVTPHTHAVDDLTEAMFQAILRESEMDADVTANEVSQFKYARGTYQN